MEGGGAWSISSFVKDCHIYLKTLNSQTWNKKKTKTKQNKKTFHFSVWIRKIKLKHKISEAYRYQEGKHGCQLCVYVLTSQWLRAVICRSRLLLLLLLSCFSRVRLCVTPETVAHQASPSLGFSRQEHWSGLPFPSPMHESGKWKWSCSVLSDS